MTGSGGFYLLVAILVVGFSPNGLNMGVKQVYGQEKTLKCLVCTYPGNVSGDEEGSLCLEPSKNFAEAVKLYSKPCGLISDFLKLLENVTEEMPNATKGQIFLPKWRRVCEASGSEQCNQTIKETMEGKMLDKAKKDFMEYGGVCKKMVVTSSARGAPGTGAWKNLSIEVTNDKWKRVVRYCGWEPRMTPDGSKVNYPTADSPFGNVGSLKFLQHINTCINKDNCNGAQAVQIGKWALVLLLVKLF